MPPRAAEAIEVPLWALRAWLKQAGVKQADFSDTVERGREEEHERRAGRCAFRWAGEDSDHTGVVYGSALRNGDLIVVPADYGGSDQWGWHPHASDRVTDVAEKAAWPYHARRFAVRVTPELIEQEIRQQRGSEDNSNTDAGGLGELAAILGQTLGDHGEERPEILLDAVLARKLPQELKSKLEMLRAQGRRRGPLKRKFAYGGEPARGVIFIAPRGLKPNGDAIVLSATPSTETEELGAASDHALDLVTHCKDVHAWAAAFAVDVGLSPPVAEDVGLAGLLHDLGKADPRYQAYYAGGTPYGPDAERALAKSGQARLPPGAWERAGLPPQWRHEALSVRLAILHPDFKRAHDPELVLWLIGAHHGHGRPLFPHADPLDAEKRRFGLPRALGAGLMLEAVPGPQSLAFDFEGRDWARIFECLKQKYGIWGLARLEAFVRLADHRASELAGPPERTGFNREAAE